MGGAEVAEVTFVSVRSWCGVTLYPGKTCRSQSLSEFLSVFGTPGQAWLIL